MKPSQKRLFHYWFAIGAFKIHFAKMISDGFDS